MDTTYEEGYYWVRFPGENWRIADCNGLGWWTITGEEVIYQSDNFAEIGPMIHPHQQLELPFTLPGNYGDYGV